MKYNTNSFGPYSFLAPDISCPYYFCFYYFWPLLFLAPIFSGPYYFWPLLYSGPDGAGSSGSGSYGVLCTNISRNSIDLLFGIASAPYGRGPFGTPKLLGTFRIGHTALVGWQRRELFQHYTRFHFGWSLVSLWLKINHNQGFSLSTINHNSCININHYYNITKLLQ